MQPLRFLRVLRLPTVGTILCITATTATLHAELSAEDKALATALFKEARTLMENNEVAEACRKFQESHRLDPSGGTLLNLAACNEKLGRTATAWTHYNEALAWARRDRREDRMQFAAEHMHALEPRLSYVVIEVPESARVEGLEIRRDGSVVRKAAWGSRMPLDPGAHVVEASADGYRAWRTEVTVDAEGSEQTVLVPVLVPLAPSSSNEEPVQDVVGAKPTRSPEPETETTAGSAPWTAYALTGVGVVGIGVGTYFGLRAFSKDAEADDACPKGECTAEGRKLTDQAGEAADVSTVAFSVGIVALGSGVAIWLLDSEEPETGATLRPEAGPGHAGIRWSGRF